MIRDDRLCVWLVEFLNQCKNVAGVAFQLAHQIRTAGSHELLTLGFSQQTAGFKGAAYLLVQFVAICQYHDGWRALKLPTDLLRQEEHGIALAGALRMPKHTQLAITQLTIGVCLHSGIHAQVLMVPGQNLYRFSIGMIVEDEVFKQVKEVLLFADAPQHRFQSNAAFVFLGQ